SLGEKVGVVEVRGAILSSESLIDDLITFRDNDSVKAIVLRIDSPGGGVAPSQEVHEEVVRTLQSKPVVVSMGSVAASGGYYIAAPCSRIVANPGSLTGSIGVIMEFTNIEQLMQKVGLYNEVVKSGKHKDIGSPVRPMTPDDRALLQGVIDDVHRQFVDAVASGRKLPREEVAPLADGRIFTGRQARDLGLVDELGNLEDAIRLAASLGGIEGEPDVVYPAEETPRVFDYLIEQAAEAFQRGLRDESHGLQYRWSGVH
ncbi:MAG: signal peptide peptidase SppA, partial [Desulfuromonas sp.]